MPERLSAEELSAVYELERKFYAHAVRALAPGDQVIERARRRMLATSQAQDAERYRAALEEAQQRLARVLWLMESSRTGEGLQDLHPLMGMLNAALRPPTDGDS